MWAAYSGWGERVAEAATYDALMDELDRLEINDRHVDCIEVDE